MLVTKNLIQNALKAMKNRSMHIHLTFNNGTHLLAQYEESLEPEKRNRFSPSCSTLQFRTEALKVSFFYSGVETNLTAEQLPDYLANQLPS